MDTLEAINTRVSAVRLTEPGPTDEQLDIILKAALRAPDHGRLSPWRLVVIEGGGREQLGQAYIDLKCRLTADEAKVNKEAEMAKAFRAPTVIAVSTNLVLNHKVPPIEQNLAVAASVQNMLLAAHALGLGAMWKTGALAYDTKMKKRLGLKASDSIVGFVFLGTAEKRLQPRTIDLKQHVTWL